MPTQTPTAALRAEQFLRVASDFHLGSLLTESAHPRTADLSEVARRSTEEGLAALFDVDGDVVHTYREWSGTAQPGRMAAAALETLRRGGRLFFTGCGATGRLSIQLDAAWRSFWQARAARGLREPAPGGWEGRTRSAMAGGDYALIKSVEGFEDFAPFGRRQVADLGLAAGDTLFAITEGGETSFVIGTAWQGVEAGAQVFFVYNNPDEDLRSVRRSREILDEARIEKVNLASGPMAITGSTRMQATSMELLAMLTVLEIVLRELLGEDGRREAGVSRPEDVPAEMRVALQALHASLASDAVLGPLAALVEMEERIYRRGGRTSYFAHALAVDVLTDTTERSPTFCTPPFRKWDDAEAAESWAFLFTAEPGTPAAWRGLLRREPQTIEWAGQDLRQLLDEESTARLAAVLGEIGHDDLMRFRIGLDGLVDRPTRAGDAVSVVVTASDLPLLQAGAAFTRRLEEAVAADADAALVAVGRHEELHALWASAGVQAAGDLVALPVADTPFLLDPITRVGVKMLLNALSTGTMVRLGRVLGNRMIWVVPSNLKLIDRATRYVADLAGVDYEQACRALFEVIEYVEPRRAAGKVYPPPVGVATMRLRHGIGLEEAEARLDELTATPL
ncbi:MAG: sugar phosphate isomerase [Acidobacteria bacterium]|nr:sugar phosphate isomerase [Acidobacteriota bacterium]